MINGPQSDLTGFTIDGELKFATQLPKGYMILGDKENFKKMGWIK